MILLLNSVVKKVGAVYTTGDFINGKRNNISEVILNRLDIKFFSVSGGSEKFEQFQLETIFKVVHLVTQNIEYTYI